jgi:hypothetical protein
LRGVIVRGEAAGVEGTLAEAEIPGAGRGLLDAGVFISAGFSFMGRLGSRGIVLSWEVGAIGEVPWRWAESGRGGITGGFDKADAVSAIAPAAGIDELAACDADDVGAGGSGVVGGGPDRAASGRGGTEPVVGLPAAGGGVDGAAA